MFCSFALVAEALGTLVLWFFLWRDPELASAFLPADVAPELIRTFLVADLVTFVALPLAAGHGVFHRCRWAKPVLWLHAGGVLNVALWAGWQAVTTGAGLVGGLVLGPLALLALWFAWSAAPDVE